MDKTSFNVKFFDWDYLHLTAQTKETYFSKNQLDFEGQLVTLERLRYRKKKCFALGSETFNQVCMVLRNFHRSQTKIISTNHISKL